MITLEQISKLIPYVAGTMLVSYGMLLLFQVRRIQSINNKQIQEIAELVGEGYQAFIRRVLSSMIQILIYSSLVFILVQYLIKHFVYWDQIGAFVFGGGLIAAITIMFARFSPQIPLKILEKSQIYLKDAIRTTFNASSSLAFIQTGAMILGLFLTIDILGPKACIGYGLGIIYTTFFLRIASGMFKSATDITEDTISELDSAIPKNDRRNPATLMDILGNFIGEVVGFSSDILGSFIFALISAVLLAYTMEISEIITPQSATILRTLPIIVISISMFTAIFTHLAASIRIKFQFQNFLLENLYASVAISGILTWIAILIFRIPVSIAFVSHTASNFHPLFSYLSGLIGAIFIATTSEWLSSNRFKPTQTISRNAEFGSVISFLTAFSLGLRSNLVFVFYIAIIALISVISSSYYGIAMATLGMLSTISTIMAINFFKPFSTAVYKMANLAETGMATEKNVKDLLRIGQTTAALGNGFNSGAAVLSAIALFFSFMLLNHISQSNFLIIDVPMLIGIIIGIGFPMLFSGLLMKGLIHATTNLMKEVSRQFREIPYLKEDKARPDIITASDKTSIWSINALTAPGFWMILLPLVIGILSIKALFGMVLGTLLIGLIQGFQWATLGDALNNAKGYIGQGFLGGPESKSYQYLAQADNIGDAFKDLMGPGMNILIKAISMIAMLIIVFRLIGI